MAQAKKQASSGSEETKTSQKKEQTLINFKVDSSVKEASESVLASMGLSMSSYLGMCLRIIAQDNKIPFDFEIDPIFWIKTAKAGKAANYIKSGLFNNCWNLHNNICDDAEKNIIELILDSNNKEIELQDADFATLDLTLITQWQIFSQYVNELAVSKIADMKKIIENPTRIRLCERLGFDVGNADQVHEKIVISFNEMIDKKVDDFISKEIPELADADFDFKANAVDGILDSVLSVYENDRDQLLLRFVGSELYVGKLEAVINERDERMKRAKFDNKQEETVCHQNVKPTTKSPNDGSENKTGEPEEFAGRNTLQKMMDLFSNM